MQHIINIYISQFLRIAQTWSSHYPSPTDKNAAETLGAIVVRDVAREAPGAFAKIHLRALIENLKYGWHNSTCLVFRNYCWFKRV